MPRFLHVVGARPNFMKIAPLLRVLDARPGWENVLVHTGQHYDHQMSASFFRDLDMREPDVNLGVGSGSHGAQTAAVLSGMETVLNDHRPDLLVVVGDVNSTVAAALAAVKLLIPVAHVEAGLRSGDRRMPEEINRILTDQLAALCLTPSRDADENLAREGIGPDRIRFVGNIMIDSLLASVRRADAPAILAEHGVEPRGYGLVTLHRPSNVDEPHVLEGILRALDEIARERPLLFPAHPRTRERLATLDYAPRHLRLIDPVSYLHMMALLDNAALVLTDSGGLQEETTALGVPCFTLRSSTERPITITEGTNVLVPDRSAESILRAVRERPIETLERRAPEGWDGRTAERIADVFETWLQGERNV
jgi:UDP-N-acetylglucosamine 2-epimerase (non-hydrolysing)